MDLHLIRATLGTVIATRVLVISDQLLLFRVDGNHRLIAGLKAYRLLIDVFELSIAIRMSASFPGLAIDLAAILQLDSELRNAAGADCGPHLA